LELVAALVVRREKGGSKRENGGTNHGEQEENDDGVIVGNRGFFPDHLAKTGREEMIRALQKAGMDVVVLGPDQTKYGAVETYEEAKSCAELFKSRAEAIDGVVVALPNFGDERAMRTPFALSRLGVPVLVQATPDTPGTWQSHTAATASAGRCLHVTICANMAFRIR